MTKLITYLKEEITLLNKPGNTFERIRGGEDRENSSFWLDFYQHPKQKDFTTIVIKIGDNHFLTLEDFIKDNPNPADQTWEKLDNWVIAKLGLKEQEKNLWYNFKKKYSKTKNLIAQNASISYLSSTLPSISSSMPVSPARKAQETQNSSVSSSPKKRQSTETLPLIPISSQEFERNHYTCISISEDKNSDAEAESNKKIVTEITEKVVFEEKESKRKQMTFTQYELSFECKEKDTDQSYSKKEEDYKFIISKEPHVFFGDTSLKDKELSQKLEEKERSKNISEMREQLAKAIQSKQKIVEDSKKSPKKKEKIDKEEIKSKIPDDEFLKKHVLEYANHILEELDRLKSKLDPSAFNLISQAFSSDSDAAISNDELESFLTAEAFNLYLFLSDKGNLNRSFFSTYQQIAFHLESLKSTFQGDENNKLLDEIQKLIKELFFSAVKLPNLKNIFKFKQIAELICNIKPGKKFPDISSIKSSEILYKTLEKFFTKNIFHHLLADSLEENLKIKSQNDQFFKDFLTRSGSKINEQLAFKVGNKLLYGEDFRQYCEEKDKPVTSETLDEWVITELHFKKEAWNFFKERYMQGQTYIFLKMAEYVPSMDSKFTSDLRKNFSEHNFFPSRMGSSNYCSVLFLGENGEILNNVVELVIGSTVNTPFSDCPLSSEKTILLNYQLSYSDKEVKIYYSPKGIVDLDQGKILFGKEAKEKFSARKENINLYISKIELILTQLEQNTLQYRYLEKTLEEFQDLSKESKDSDKFREKENYLIKEAFNFIMKYDQLGTGSLKHLSVFNKYQKLINSNNFIKNKSLVDVKENLEQCLFSLLYQPTRERLYAFDFMLEFLINKNFNLAGLNEALQFIKEGRDDQFFKNLIDYNDSQIKIAFGLNPNIKKVVVNLPANDPKFPADICLKKLIKIALANNLISMSKSFDRMLKVCNGNSVEKTDLEFPAACRKIANEVLEEIKEKNFAIDSPVFNKAMKLLQIYESFQGKNSIEIIPVLKEIGLYDSWVNFWKFINTKTFEIHTSCLSGKSEIIANDGEEKCEVTSPSEEEVWEKDEYFEKDVNLTQPLEYRQHLVKLILNYSRNLSSSSDTIVTPLLTEIMIELENLSKAFFLPIGEEEYSRLDHTFSLSGAVPLSSSFSISPSSEPDKKDRFSRSQAQLLRLNNALLTLKNQPFFSEIMIEFLKASDILFRNLLDSIENSGHLSDFDKLLNTLEKINFSLKPKKIENVPQMEVSHEIDSKEELDNSKIDLTISFEQLRKYLCQFYDSVQDKDKFIFLSLAQSVAKTIVSTEFILSKIKLSSAKQGELALLLNKIDVSELNFGQLELLLTWVDQAPSFLEKNSGEDKIEILFAPIQLLLDWQKVSALSRKFGSVKLEVEEDSEAKGTDTVTKDTRISFKVSKKIDGWISTSTSGMARELSNFRFKSFKNYYLEALTTGDVIEYPFDLTFSKQRALELVLLLGNNNECSLAELSKIGAQLEITEKNLAQAKINANLEELSKKAKVPRILAICRESKDKWFTENSIDMKATSAEISKRISQNIDDILRRSRPDELILSENSINEHLIFLNQLEELRNYISEDQDDALRKVNRVINDGKFSIKNKLQAESNNLLSSFVSHLKENHTKEEIQIKYLATKQAINNLYRDDYKLELDGEKNLALSSIDRNIKGKESDLYSKLRWSAEEVIAAFKLDLMESVDGSNLEIKYKESQEKLANIFSHEVPVWDFSSLESSYQLNLKKRYKIALFEINLKSYLVAEKRKECFESFLRSNEELLKDSKYKKQIEKIYQKYDSDNILVKFSSFDMAESVADLKQRKLITEVRKDLGYYFATYLELSPPDLEKYLSGLKQIRKNLISNECFDFLIFKNLINDLDNIIWKLSLPIKLKENFHKANELMKQFKSFLEDGNLELIIKDEKEFKGLDTSAELIPVDLKLKKIIGKLQGKDNNPTTLPKYQETVEKLNKSWFFFFLEKRKLRIKLAQISRAYQSDFAHAKKNFSKELLNFFELVSTLYERYGKQDIFSISEFNEIQGSYQSLLTKINTFDRYTQIFPDVADIINALRPIVNLFSLEQLATHEVVDEIKGKKDNNFVTPLNLKGLGPCAKARLKNNPVNEKTVRTPQAITSQFVRLESLVSSGKSTSPAVIPENLILQFSVAEMMGIFLEDHLQANLEVTNSAESNLFYQHKLLECIEKHPRLAINLFDTILLIKKRCEKDSLSGTEMSQCLIRPYHLEEEKSLSLHNKQLLSGFNNLPGLINYLDKLAIELVRVNHPADKLLIEFRCFRTKFSLGCYLNNDQALHDLRSRVSSYKDNILTQDKQKNLESCKLLIKDFLARNFPNKFKEFNKIKFDQMGLRAVKNIFKEIFDVAKVINHEILNVENISSDLKLLKETKENDDLFSFVRADMGEIKKHEKRLSGNKKRLLEFFEIMENLSVFEFLIKNEIEKNKEKSLSSDEKLSKKPIVISSLADLEAYCCSLLDRSELFLQQQFKFSSENIDSRVIALKPVEDFIESLKPKSFSPDNPIVDTAPTELYLQALQIYNAMRMNLGLEVVVLTESGYREGTFNNNPRKGASEESSFVRTKKLFDILVVDGKSDSFLKEEMKSAEITAEQKTEVEKLDEKRIKREVEKLDEKRIKREEDPKEMKVRIKSSSDNDEKENKSSHPKPKQVKSSLFFSMASATQQILSNFRNLAARSTSLKELAMFFNNQLEQIFNVASKNNKSKLIIELFTILISRLEAMYVDNVDALKSKKDQDQVKASYKELIISETKSFLKNKMFTSEKESIPEELGKLFQSQVGMLDLSNLKIVVINEGQDQTAEYTVKDESLSKIGFSEHSSPGYAALSILIT